MESGDKSPPSKKLRHHLISQIQQSSGVPRHLAVFDREIDTTDIDSAATHLENNRVLAGGRLLQHRLFHERVRVAAGNEIDAVDLRGDLCISNLISPLVWIVPEMRHTNDKRTPFLLAQELDHGPGRGHRIEILQRFE